MSHMASVFYISAGVVYYFQCFYLVIRKKKIRLIRVLGDCCGSNFFLSYFRMFYNTINTQGTYLQIFVGCRRTFSVFLKSYLILNFIHSKI